MTTGLSPQDFAKRLDATFLVGVTVGVLSAVIVLLA